MTLTQSKSNLVYKIVTQTEWAHACATGSFAGSVDDVRDGYIHLSGPDQISGTLQKHFRNQKELLLVAFQASSLAPHDLRYEISRGGAVFPHLYRPLPTHLALWQRPLELGLDGVPAFEETWLSC
jgi:uncharacterized protein (DUF952 family)